jgi:hypothetical protein
MPGGHGVDEAHVGGRFIALAADRMTWHSSRTAHAWTKGPHLCCRSGVVSRPVVQVHVRVGVLQAAKARPRGEGSQQSPLTEPQCAALTCALSSRMVYARSSRGWVRLAQCSSSAHCALRSCLGASLEHSSRTSDMHGWSIVIVAVPLKFHRDHGPGSAAGSIQARPCIPGQPTANTDGLWDFAMVMGKQGLVQACCPSVPA